MGVKHRKYSDRLNAAHPRVSPDGSLDVAPPDQDELGVFQTPHLHGSEASEHRAASWLELFFDLFFVAAITRLAHHLATHFSMDGVLQFAVAFTALWWIWMSDTYYSIRFETRDAIHRLYVLALMFPVLFMAIFGAGEGGGAWVPFAIAFLIARAINTLMWARAAYHVPVARGMIKWFLLGFAVSTAILSAMLFTGPELHLPILAAAVFVSVASVAFSLPAQTELPKLPRDKLPERHGLFGIIILGETIVPLAVPPAELAYLDGLVIGAGIAIAFGFWWLYFDFVGRRPPKPSPGWTMIWGYMHLPVSISLTLNGVAVAMVVKGEVANGPAILMICSAVTLLLISVMEISIADNPGRPFPTAQTGPVKLSAATLLLGGAYLFPQDARVAVGTVVSLLVAIAAYSTWRWAVANRRAPEAYDGMSLNEEEVLGAPEDLHAPEVPA